MNFNFGPPPAVTLSPAERRGTLWRVGGAFLKRDHGFESAFLQRRVTRTPVSGLRQRIGRRDSLDAERIGAAGAPIAGERGCHGADGLTGAKVDDLFPAGFIGASCDDSTEDRRRDHVSSTSSSGPRPKRGLL